MCWRKISLLDWNTFSRNIWLSYIPRKVLYRDCYRVYAKVNGLEMGVLGHDLIEKLALAVLRPNGEDAFELYLEI
jgi:hypothetical protein